MEKCRINKYIALCGVCSRRDADSMIAEGRVIVNGEIAKAGMKVSADDIIIVDDRIIRQPDGRKVIAYYKPIGVTCTERDEHADRIVTDEVISDVRVTYAGRLDRDSEGLLIMTDDGDLIHEMMSAKSSHEKEYEVWIDHEILNEDVIKLRNGIFLHDLEIKTKPCRVETINPKLLNIVLTQGVNRQIRRMLGECGYRVERLCRTRIMNVKLAKMSPGEQRDITGEELAELYKECGLKGSQNE